MGEKLHLSGTLYDLFSVLAAVAMKRCLLGYNSVKIGERFTRLNDDISQQRELSISWLDLETRFESSAHKTGTSSGTFEAFLSLSAQILVS
jgi:hypothetical protein